MSRHTVALISLLACFSTVVTGRVNASSPAQQIIIAQAGTGPLRIHEIATQITDSLRLKMLSAIANGDIGAAIVAWQAHTGRQDIPRWLGNLQSAFQVANQRAGSCKDVARNILEGFKQLGKNAAYLRFRTEGAHKTANLMAFELRAGEPRSTVQVSNNSTHYAVQAGGRIYDAFTGPAGLEMADYLTRLISPGTITYETVSHLP